ncbi:MAG: LysM peptidoglycan-binding domain-containing protein [Clostridiales bacterium]|jgi:LysM repeat protein|nr:LysM peptidoglycan-binding domain-containing protein [Eubacteriales bacterium]MDH7565137.1 LysM peptidoglycan-binding domain-containing protein [Clostridiales bacterium]
MKKRYVLKNKRRFTLFAAVILTLVFALVFAPASYGDKTVSYQKIQVKKGDTLWGIAEKYNQRGDIREYIYQLKKINNLKDSSINQGSLLVIPIGS